MKRILKVFEEDKQMADHVNEDSKMENDIAGFQVNFKPTKDQCPLTFSKRCQYFYPCLAKVANLVF